MDRFELFCTFAEGVLGRPLEEFAPEHMSGWEVVEALWPLNERFRPNFDLIKSLPYDPSFEAEADDAIRSFIADTNASWDTLSAGAWRVLLERHQQAIMVALANEAEGNPLMPIPAGFPQAHRTAAALIFLQYQMMLPWPPFDRSSTELPPGSAQATLRRH